MWSHCAMSTQRVHSFIHYRHHRLTGYTYNIAKYFICICKYVSEKKLCGQRGRGQRGSISDLVYATP